MPIYEYKCTKCEHEFETLQGMNDRPLRKCPECKGKIERMQSAPAFQFKGSGWYVTDYGKGGSSKGSGGSDGDSGGSSKSEGSSSSSTKSDGKDSKSSTPKKKKAEAKK